MVMFSSSDIAAGFERIPNRSQCSTADRCEGAIPGGSRDRDQWTPDQPVVPTQDARITLGCYEVGVAGVVWVNDRFTDRVIGFDRRECAVLNGPFQFRPNPLAN